MHGPSQKVLDKLESGKVKRNIGPAIWSFCVLIQAELANSCSFARRVQDGILSAACVLLTYIIRISTSHLNSRTRI
jgi:hypothetical protein